MMINDWSLTLAVLLISYLLGSVPFGLVLTRLMRLGDLRDIGSGNIGATNVMRTGNKLAGLLTLLLDGGKGAFAALLASVLLDSTTGQMAAMAAFLGHLYPIWLRFRGGKGVATYLGILIAFSIPAGLLACLTWLITFVALRISSLASMATVLTAPLYLILLSHSDAMIVTIIMSLWVLAAHHQNILRLLKGTEPRMDFSKQTKSHQ